MLFLFRPADVSCAHVSRHPTFDIPHYFFVPRAHAARATACVLRYSGRASAHAVGTPPRLTAALSRARRFVVVKKNSQLTSKNLYIILPMVIPISDTLSARPFRSCHPATFGSYRNSYFASDAACRGSLSRPPSGSSRRVALRAHTWSSICPYSSSRCIGSRACVSHPSYPMSIGQCDNVIKERLYRPPFQLRHCG